MCGRFNVVSDPLHRFIEELTGQRIELADRYNIAPTEEIPVLLRSNGDDWQVREMRWWLVPSWADAPDQKYAMYNARSENLARSRAFREPFRHRRCIVPASGYYEWRLQDGKKIPYYITPAEADGFAFAGLWDRWQKEERIIDSCTIVTTAAPEDMKTIHDRMPVHLTNEQVQTWVASSADEDSLANLLAPGLRMPLAVTPVSTVVNNARNKDPRCIEPVGDSMVIQ